MESRVFDELTFVAIRVTKLRSCQWRNWLGINKWIGMRIITPRTPIETSVCDEVFPAAMQLQHWKKRHRYYHTFAFLTFSSSSRSIPSSSSNDSDEQGLHSGRVTPLFQRGLLELWFPEYTDLRLGNSSAWLQRFFCWLTGRLAP